MIYSRQREAVLDALRGVSTHPTAEELFDLLRKKQAGISLATVYRNLNQLAENGIILRIPTPDGPDRFDGDTTTHYHAVCTTCGRTIDIFTDKMPDVCAAANAPQDEIDISGVTMLFTGTCKKCHSDK